MKKILIAAAIVAVTAAVIFAIPQGRSDAEYLRIHIRADSNDAADQNVKYEVKSAVVDYLTPYLAEVKDKADAMRIVRAHLDGIECAANRVLQARGFGYTATAKLTSEQFPDRTYGDLTLKQGVYDALILELGSGKGDNWWCVVYPPLCFVGGESNGSNTIVYKSKLMEIINQWRASHGK